MASQLTTGAIAADGPRTAVASSRPEPVATDARLAGLDILRAIALFGVFVINMEFFARPIETSGYGIEPGLRGLDRMVAWCEYTFVHGKFWMLFAMLFGMGFAVMLERARIAQRGFVAPYLRRLALLLGFGIAHAALLWAGDILHTYAIAGCALLLVLHGRPWWLLLPVAAFAAAWVAHGGRGYLGGVVGFTLLACAAAWIRRGDSGRLWRAGAMLYVSAPCVILAMTLPRLFLTASAQQQAAAAERVAQWQADVARAAWVNAQGSYLDNVALRLRFVVDGLADRTVLLVLAVGMFLIGVWFVRSGILRDLGAHRALLRRIAAIGIAAGLPLALTSASVSTAFDPQRSALYTVAAQLMTLASLPLSVGYACAVLWLVQAGARLSWLAPAGRMALTNYLVQSAFGTLLFHGYGAGLGGRVDRVGQLLLVVVVFALQIALSHWWLRRFRFGPAEWLWRAGTYGALPAMRRHGTPASAAQPVAPA